MYVRVLTCCKVCVNGLCEGRYIWCEGVLSFVSWHSHKYVYMHMYVVHTYLHTTYVCTYVCTCVCTCEKCVVYVCAYVCTIIYVCTYIL